MKEQMIEPRVASTAVDWQRVVDALEDGVVVLSEEMLIVACNQATAATLGRPVEELIGCSPEDLGMRPLGDDGQPLPVEEYPASVAIRTGTPVRSEIGIHDSDGRIRWLAFQATPLGLEARPAAVVVNFRDITARRDYESELRRQAERDDLTGLPNRRAFLSALDDHLASRRREDSRGALLLLDFDHFKELNDSLGHVAGDRALVHAARALEERLRSTDLLGRIGGDEFAVLLPRADREEAEQVAAGLSTRLREERVPTVHGGVRQLTASIGAVLLDGPAGANVERALQYADDAMYTVKTEGRDGWQVAGPQAPVKRSRQLALANALGTRLVGLSDTDRIAEVTVEELHRAFGFHMCAVIRLRDDQRVEALAVRGDPFVALNMRSWSQPAAEGVIGRCLRDREPVLVNDVLADADYNVTPETVDVRSELVVPLLVEDRVWGAINLEELVENAFDEGDSQLLSILANQVASAIRSAMLVERLGG